MSECELFFPTISHDNGMIMLYFLSPFGMTLPSSPPLFPRSRYNNDEVDGGNNERSRTSTPGLTLFLPLPYSLLPSLSRLSLLTSALLNFLSYHPHYHYYGTLY